MSTRRSPKCASASAGLPAEYAYAWMSLADMPDDLTERHLELWCGPVRQALETAA